MHTPLGVSRGSTTESQGMERASWGEDLAIGIACFTTPPPLIGDQTVVSCLDMYRTNVLMYRTMVLLARPTKVRR